MSENILRYDLLWLCDQCPFRRDTLYLPLERRRKIAESIREGDSFTCHKTIDYGNPDQPISDRQHCAGAMIALLKDGIINLCMALAERFVPGFEVRDLEMGDDSVMGIGEFEGRDYDRR